MQRIAPFAVVVAIAAVSGLGYSMLIAQQDRIEELESEHGALNAQLRQFRKLIEAKRPQSPETVSAAQVFTSDEVPFERDEPNLDLEQAIAANAAALNELQSAVAELQKQVRTMPIMQSIIRERGDAAQQAQVPPDQYIPAAEEVPAIEAQLLSRRATIGEKLIGLRQLRNADARSEAVANHMADVYYDVESASARADIFRQLDGVVTPGLRTALLDAVAKDQAPDVREEAAETMAHFLPDDEVQQWLEYLAANDADRDVREQATASLRELNTR